MKFLLLLLVLTSCGKKLAKGDVTFDLSELAQQDRDGDGINDTTELSQSRNPFVAEIREVLPVIPAEVTLVQNDGKPIKMAPSVSRKLRRLLIDASLREEKTKDLPSVSQLELSFIHQPGYWRTRMSGKHFTRIDTQELSATKIDPGFIDTPIITLNAQIENGSLLDVTDKSYRLIISRPEGEQIFYVSVELPVRDFLHQSGLLPKGQPLSPHADEAGWRLVNTDHSFSQKPLAGETYAIVYGSAEDFRRAEVRGLKLNLLARKSLRFERPQRFNMTVVLNNIQKAVTQSKTNIHTLSSHPDYQHLTCKFTSVSLLRREAVIPRSVEAVLERLDLNGAFDLSLGWIEIGHTAVAANITLSVNSDAWTPQFQHALTATTIQTGVVDSACGRAVPVRAETHALYTEISGDVLIGDQI